MADSLPEGFRPPNNNYRRRGSFAQTDVLKYRKVFDTHDETKQGHIKAAQLGEAVQKLGYRISEDKIQVLNISLHIIHFFCRLRRIKVVPEGCSKVSR